MNLSEEVEIEKNKFSRSEEAVHSNQPDKLAGAQLHTTWNQQEDRLWLMLCRQVSAEVPDDSLTLDQETQELETPI